MRLRHAPCMSIVVLVTTITPPAPAADDPLPSWNDGPAKAAIVCFVGDVTKEGSPGFVPTEERVATFDNDGTLWSEQPYYNQVAFALAREGGLASPSLGRNPRGAKNKEINPASSSIPSDWYPEKSCAALTKERKHAKQIASIPRGHKFNTSSTDAIIPTQQIPVSMCRPLENHSSVGAYQ